MIPRKKKNGSRSASPEKPPLQVGIPRSSQSQYGSDMGKWGNLHIPGPQVNTPLPDQAEQDQRFHQLQDMFNGQLDAQIVFLILSECGWKVEDAVEKLLQLASQNPLPTLDTDTTSEPSIMTSHRSNQLKRDMTLNLRSRLPSVPNTDQSDRGSSVLPLLSPRTPSVSGLDYPAFPGSHDIDPTDDNIQVMLNALDSYANPDLSAYVGAFQSQTSCDDMLHVAELDPGIKDNTFGGGYPVSSTIQDSTAFSQCPTDNSMENFASMSKFGGTHNGCQDQSPYANMGGLNIYSQTFQPIQTVSPPVLPNNSQEGVSARTAFNSVVLGESSLILGESSLMTDSNNRRPVREDSKDSAASDVSRVSDLSHVSDEPLVDLSPGLVKKRHHRQVLRRQNISLDPQERASLEQLIEEVLIGGVDDGVMDPDDSSDEDDDEHGEGGRIKRLSRSEDGTKLAPSQLKVAAKHMKNLPPRFQKRLQASIMGGRVSGEDGELEVDELEFDGLHLEEVLKLKKPKKKIKGLLDSLDQYVEDDVPVTDPESEDGECVSEGIVFPREVLIPHNDVQPPLTCLKEDQRQNSLCAGASMQQQIPASSPTPQVKQLHPHIVLRPNVVNYDALDHERVVRTPPRLPAAHSYIRPHHSSREHTPEPRVRQLDPSQQRFSLDAPEFVPRAFHPINPPPTQSVSSPLSHRDGFSGVGAYSYSPRSGSPYTVLPGNSYSGPTHSGSPYQMTLNSNLSPQMNRRPMAGSPIAIVHVAPTGRHSPIPPAFFIPKVPVTAMQAHPAMLPYAGYQVAHFPVHPGLRYAVPPGYRQPFISPSTAQQRLAPHNFKYNPKDRLQQTNARPSSAPTVAAPTVATPGTSISPRMAANLQGQPVAVSDKHPKTPFQKVFGKTEQDTKLQLENKLDKDGKEAKNFSTQHSRTSRSSTEDEMSPQEAIAIILEKGTHLMVILRGLPGSGKTHLAKELVNNGVILSTDDYFMTKDGYEFDYSNLGEAHEWNQKRAIMSLKEGHNPIIIDNTNTQAWEMKPYVLLAVKHDYIIEIVEPDTPWKFRAKELAKRNKHGVAKEHIQRMIDHYDHNVTVSNIVATFDKIKIDVEKKPRPGVQRREQQVAVVLSPAIQPADGTASTEERKTKKKTRRGKGRKKKARLRELREAEANKEREKTGDEISSDEESIPDGDQSVEKSSIENFAVSNIKDQEQVFDSIKDTCGEEISQHNKVLKKVDQNMVEKEEDSTPEKELSLGSLDNLEAVYYAKHQLMTKETEKASESDSSHDSASSPSTAESQLSQDSAEVELGKVESSDVQVEDIRDTQLLELVMKSLEINLKALLQTKQGDAKAALETLLNKFHTSAEVHSEIEDIIKEKMFEGMVNQEVEAINSSVQRLTETDVNSIMDVLGQITNVDTDSSTDSNNHLNADQRDTNSLEKMIDSKCDGDDSRKLDAKANNTLRTIQDVSGVEQAYWKPDNTSADPYLVVTDIANVKPQIKSQTSWSDSSSNDIIWENRPKARRERKRPYKKPMSTSDDFWNVSSDKPETGDSANSIASSEPGTPKQLNNMDESVGHRPRRLSGHNRLSAQFPLPELQVTDKHQLPIIDWQLPDFTTHHVPFAPPKHQPSRPKLDAETYTHPQDLALVHRILQASENVSENIIQSADIIGDQFVGILQTHPRIIYVSDEGKDVGSPVAVKSLMIDRSCSTTEFEHENSPNGLTFLKSCFATVAKDDLLEILGRCNGDVDWAADILLDAGYEYNEHPVAVHDQCIATPERISAHCDTASSASPPIHQPKSSQNINFTPPTLMQLCYAHLLPKETLTMQVQEQYVETSVQRINKISAFQRQRSTSTVSKEEQPALHSTQSSSSLEMVGTSTPVTNPDRLFPRQHSDMSTCKDPQKFVDGATDIVDDMILSLTPALAGQLIALFGPVGFHISDDSLSPKDLVVKLTRKTAKQLHRRWALTLQEAFQSDDLAIQQLIDQDEALAKRMQAEEDQQHTARLQRSALHSAQTPAAQPESLKEIMEEQMAIELSKVQHQKIPEIEQIHGHQQAQSLATKMKRQKLQEMFPKVDKASLEEVYKVSGYNMTKTLAAIRVSFGTDEPVQTVWTPEAIEAYENMLLQQALDQSLQDQWLGASEDDGDPIEVLADPQYQDYRAEASTHYRLRHECFQKAQEAHRRGLKAVACFYSQQGHLHTQKLKEANGRAAMKIVELKNSDVNETNTIDLHGLHVDETLTILSELISQRERELRQRPDKRRDHLFVVTGTGSHSRGGKAKIRPAVIDYLTRKHYNFSEGIPGMLKVQMKYRDDA